MKKRDFMRLAACAGAIVFSAGLSGCTMLTAHADCSPVPCSASASHNPIQRGMCEACFLWNARNEIKASQDAGWTELRAEWRDHYDDANDYHFQLRGISPCGDEEDVPDELPNDPS